MHLLLPNDVIKNCRSPGIAARQRSKTFTHLIEKEIEKREKALYECAAAVEKDAALRDEMKEWDVTLQDGLDDESW